MSDVRVVSPLFYEGNAVSPTSPKELNVGEISCDKAMQLNEMWHSMLPKTVKSNLTRNRKAIYFGAEAAGIFYACAIFTSPIAANRLKNGHQMLELRRFAIAPDAPKNTASYMLKRMRKIIENRFSDVRTLISYQDVSVHLGTIYKASGWVAAGETKNIEWNTGNRKRNGKQSATGSKVRWEYQIRT